MHYLIINSRKIASASDSEIYISNKMRDKISPYTKLEKKNVQGMEVLIVKEMKDKEKHGKFITEFVKRIEKTNSETPQVKVTNEKPKQEEVKKEEEKLREDNSSSEEKKE